MEKRPAAKSFEDLIVWQKAHLLVLEVYRLTKSFPQEEKFGLTSQLRRSIVSVPANIAEGFKKKSKIDKRRFLNISQGSLEESRYYLILTRDLKYAETDNALNMLQEVSRILESYMASILSSNS